MSDNADDFVLAHQFSEMNLVSVHRDIDGGCFIVRQGMHDIIGAFSLGQFFFPDILDITDAG